MAGADITAGAVAAAGAAAAEVRSLLNERGHPISFRWLWLGTLPFWRVTTVAIKAVQFDNSLTPR